MLAPKNKSSYISTLTVCLVLTSLLIGSFVSTKTESYELCMTGIHDIYWTWSKFVLHHIKGMKECGGGKVKLNSSCTLNWYRGEWLYNDRLHFWRKRSIAHMNQRVYSTQHWCWHDGINRCFHHYWKSNHGHPIYSQTLIAGFI